MARSRREMVNTLAVLPSSLAMAWLALDIFLLMLTPRWDMMELCLVRTGSDLLEWLEWVLASLASLLMSR